MEAGISVLALSGGVGGAKLALGLQGVLEPGHLSVAVNTGDDFEHLGLAISPDLDTTLYTLSGLANPELGWGRGQESWNFMSELARLGGELWFRLGDKDLALHVERTRRLGAGESLESIAEAFAARLGVATHVVPMSSDRVRTVVDTDEGTLAFQHYFVRRRCEPAVRGIRYEGAEQARAATQALEALGGGSYTAAVICPSNPYLSIDPILAIPGWRTALAARKVPVIAVSPLISGEAVKGPTAKIMRELGLEASPLTVARHYAPLIDGFVLDEADALLAGEFDIPVHIAPTLMRSLADKERLAREVLAFARSLLRTTTPRVHL
ncbi:MAG TPA: 2-phospho-L-lactate transferase [Steroidobacteraceae bacterium]|nr:2-phospho-L-lactate transferase [Steroidobacteraceae bacterium]